MLDAALNSAKQVNNVCVRKQQLQCDTHAHIYVDTGGYMDGPYICVKRAGYRIAQNGQGDWK